MIDGWKKIREVLIVSEFQNKSWTKNVFNHYNSVQLVENYRFPKLYAPDEDERKRLGLIHNETTIPMFIREMNLYSREQLADISRHVSVFTQDANFLTEGGFGMVNFNWNFYIGFMNKHAQLHGHGSMLTMNTVVFNGYPFKVGDLYIGDFVEGFQSGFGSVIEADGTKWSGEFLKGSLVSRTDPEVVGAPCI
jgi:hypothetical protein